MHHICSVLGVDHVEQVEVAEDDGVVRQAVLLAGGDQDVLRHLLAGGRLQTQQLLMWPQQGLVKRWRTKSPL